MRAAVLASGLVVILAVLASPAVAQRAAENAVASADDAFGSTVGTEKSGIYDDNDVRGFSPVRAGNLRIEGVYFDQQAFLTGRVRAGSRIRVGIAALDYPFPAPSGIVDYQLRPSGGTFVASLALLRQNYGGRNVEVDLSGPIIPDRLSLAGGITRNHSEMADGSQFTNYAVGVIPRLKFKGGEVAMIASHVIQRDATSRVVITAPSAFLPPIPEPRNYLGQDWARASIDNTNLGVMTRAELGGGWSFRGGAFQSQVLRRRSFSEIFVVSDPLGTARHSVVADPRQLNRSYSGEAQLTWRRDDGDLHHRVLFNLRGRDRTAETGGSDRRDLGAVQLGQKDPEARPTFVFRPTDESQTRQLTAGLGYVGRYANLVRVNLGVQKTRYEASFTRASATTSALDQPWLLPVLVFQIWMMVDAEK